MKKFKFAIVSRLVLSVVLLCAAAAPAHAAPLGKRQAATCKYKSADIGTIVGRGASASDAFEDAATQCYERRERQNRARTGQRLGEEAGTAIIDVCANIICA